MRCDRWRKRALGVLLLLTGCAHTASTPVPAGSLAVESARLDAQRTYEALVRMRVCESAGVSFNLKMSSVLLPAECFFQGGATSLRPEAARAVKQLASLLAAYRRSLAVAVQEEAGVEGPAVARTAARAAAIVEALVAEGSPPSRLLAIGLGREAGNEEMYNGWAGLGPGTSRVLLLFGVE
jgi:outer membrane protein OmpA-like peptidoglycan-associated protein